MARHLLAERAMIGRQKGLLDSCLAAAALATLPTCGGHDTRAARAPPGQPAPAVPDTGSTGTNEESSDAFDSPITRARIAAPAPDEEFAAIVDGLAEDIRA